MANTKIPSELIADNSVGIDALNVTDGTNGQYLQTDGAGTLSFSTVSGYTDSDVATYLGGGNTINIDTQGTIKLDGNYPTGTGNVALGDGALDDGSLSGGNNTAIGSGALTANTVSDNTAVGFNALAANTDGRINVAVGKGSMALNQTGGDNTAIGGLTLDANISGNSNTALGYAALSANTTASYNTAVGALALVNNDTGTQNVAVGALALDAVTGGSNNTALGYATLTENTTSNNTAVGHKALQFNNTGTANVAVGALALDANTSAGYQTAVGYNSLSTANGGLENTALGANTLSLTSTGSYNTAIGTTAMYGNLTGSYNVAVGRNALDANTTGQYNTAVGHSALGTITGVSASTAIGYNALRLATAGQNTALGYEAGGAVTGGGDNVLLGYRAANYQNNLTTGSDNTVVGAYTRLSSGTVTGETVIGRYALGQGANTVTLGISGNGVHIPINGSTTSWTAHSDERLKENIQDSTAGLSFINDLRPITYNWKSKKDISEDFVNYYDADSDEPVQGEVKQTNHGFIAQEVKAVIDAHPEIKEGHSIWRESPDGIQNLADGALMPMMVKAIQELSAQVEELKSRLGD